MHSDRIARVSWFLGIAFSLGAALLAGGSAGAQDQPPAKPQDQPSQEKKRDLTDLSIEELSQIEVTSVSKKGESLMDAPAAIAVIRGEDLRRMGIRSFAEALRMAPGMQVARINSGMWAIGARGFADRFASKLLVLVDGRSVYNPLFSGVFWEYQDTLLEDVDRIEVIRGPGATVWGSNAVTGVINIITKKAKDTQGGYVELGGGTEERGIAGARYGGKSGDDLSYRVFAKYLNRDEGDLGDDQWYQSRAGFRADWTPSADDTFTFSGEVYGGATHWEMTLANVGAPPFYRTSIVNRSDSVGGHFIARWEHKVSPTSDLSAQLSYDHWQYEDDNWAEDWDTLDLDLRYRFSLLDWNDLTVGGGGRLSADDFDGGDTNLIQLDPDNETVGNANVFIQDEITLIKDQLRLTLGARFEYNQFSHFEYQPGVRLSWRPHENHALWASASRSVRVPSRAEDAIRVAQAVMPPPTPFPPFLPFPTVMTIWGNHDWKSEELVALELGYRVQPIDVLSVDTALFLNLYDNLRTNEFGTPFPDTVPIPNYFVWPLVFDNKAEARSYGAEVSATWRVMDGWTVMGHYSYILLNMNQDEDSNALTAEDDERDVPRNQVYLRSSWDFLDQFQFDLVARHVDVLPGPDVPSYVEMDARLGWRAAKNFEVSLVCQNMWHDDHWESPNSSLGDVSTQVERGVYLMVSGKF